MTNMTREELLADIAQEKLVRSGMARYRADPHEYNRKRYEAHKKRREKLVELAGGKCLDCDVDYPSYILDFHHRDPATKELELNLAGMSRAWDRIVKEAEKCDLLCSNCHRRRHYNEREHMYSSRK